MRQRTTELSLVNEQLQQKIIDLERTEEKLRRKTEETERLLEMVPAAVWFTEDPQCSRYHR